MAGLGLVPAVHRATHRIGLYLASAEPRMSQGEAHILAHLLEAGSCTIAALHRALAHRRSTLTSILDRLSERGFITREVARDDRRSFVVALTPRGRAAATRVARRLRALERAVSAKTSAQDLEACLRVLVHLEETAETMAAR